MVHSQSGEYGLKAAIARPGLVKALVTVEPRSCAASDEQIKTALVRTPMLAVFGDHIRPAGGWSMLLAQCQQTTTRIAAAGGAGKTMHLPEMGVTGNSHMMMMDRNNLQIAHLILAWLKSNVRR